MSDQHAQPAIAGPHKNLPTDLLAEIGRVIVNWSHLETIVEVAIWSFVQIPPREGAALTTPLRFRQRMDVLDAVARNYLGDGPLLEQYRAIHARVTAAYSDRNKVDHAIWWHFGPTSVPAIRVQVRTKNLPNPQVEQMTVAQINTVAVSIDKVMWELNNFLEKHTPPPPSHPAAPRKNPR